MKEIVCFISDYLNYTDKLEAQAALYTARCRACTCPFISRNEGLSSGVQAFRYYFTLIIITNIITDNIAVNKISKILGIVQDFC
jgi:hypothetical protein